MKMVALEIALTNKERERERAEFSSSCHITRRRLGQRKRATRVQLGPTHLKKRTNIGSGPTYQKKGTKLQKSAEVADTHPQEEILTSQRAIWAIGDHFHAHKDEILHSRK